MSEDKDLFDRLRAKCPRCGKALTMDESGCPSCSFCRNEFIQKFGYGEGLERYVGLVCNNYPEFLNSEQPILKEGSIEKIRKALEFQNLFKGSKFIIEEYSEEIENKKEKV